MAEQGGRKMNAVAIVAGSIFLFGGCGYYGFTRYRRTGIESALGSAVLILVVVWLFGGLHLDGF